MIYIYHLTHQQPCSSKQLSVSGLGHSKAGCRECRNGSVDDLFCQINFRSREIRYNLIPTSMRAVFCSYLPLLLVGCVLLLLFLGQSRLLVEEPLDTTASSVPVTKPSRAEQAGSTATPVAVPTLHLVAVVCGNRTAADAVRMAKVGSVPIRQNAQVI